MTIDELVSQLQEIARHGNNGGNTVVYIPTPSDSSHPDSVLEITEVYAWESNDEMRTGIIIT